MTLSSMARPEKGAALLRKPDAVGLVVISDALCGRKATGDFATPALLRGRHAGEKERAGTHSGLR
ncbi:hypothetical protein ACDY97_29025 [Rhizobium mongolense]|uniref:hypothetical protein n=1 Tax=Rhizobium TaxID=379 RepID=UPI0024B0BEEC|nr:hypothetical protein [Rhizobium sp. CC1099]WFU86387.1 hypothetical protein QA644_14785 [Rhizobium sp. CC1099]